MIHIKSCIFILILCLSNLKCKNQNLLEESYLISLDDFNSKIKNLCSVPDSITIDSILIESIRVLNTFRYYDSLEEDAYYLDILKRKYSKKIFSVLGVTTDLNGFLVNEKYNIYIGRKHSKSYYSIIGLREKGISRSTLIRREKSRKEEDDVPQK